ncbi:class I tRNA ligase family protein [Streptomyces sp. NPDC020898]|uniref:class I tRNA ligase family protein n=1 Tax=Streptomyces sp. NPDC020898 TaxID=3365101 RepID=UPI0037B09CEC
MFGIDMGAVEGLGVGASWARVPPGSRSDMDRHDESETIVIVAGEGTVLVNGEPHLVSAGTVVSFDPFEAHMIENTSATDLVFLSLYWRDAERTAGVVKNRAHHVFGDRPVFVFSTPPTPNGDLHLGHLSGPYLGADVFVRFQRLNGVDAWHLTGSDDFQSYVVDAARREGRTPAETSAHYSAEIAATLKLMDIEPDQYTATNQDPTYPDGLRAFFSRLVDSGAVAPKEGDALFDAETGRYLYEVDVHGVCPSCLSAAGGNICEECGEPNHCADLVDPRASQSTAPPVVGTATRFSLSLHNMLRSHLMEHHGSGRVPARLRELAERLSERYALDVALTHPSSWGVSPAESGTPGQVIWVWPEMAYGFLHGIELLGRGLGENWRAESPQTDWQLVHFFGYDNSFYHGILYPALYRLAFPSWTPRIDYHVNEFYLLEGEKFSTSRRHAIWGKEILSPETVDAVRFHLSLTRPEGRRTNFERKTYEAVLRETLLGGWQAWLNALGDRVEKEYAGEAPDAGRWTPEHSAFLSRLGDRLAELTTSLGKDRFSLNDAAAALDGIVQDSIRFNRAENATLMGHGAWRAEARTATALELAAARLLAHGAAPVMPRFSARLAAALGEAAPSAWPKDVELLRAGSRVHLSQEVFFRLVHEGDPS